MTHQESTTDIARIGMIVKQRRQAMGLKQVECAGLLGVGVRFISELENGKRTLEVAKVLHVLKGLKINVMLEYDVEQ